MMRAPAISPTPRNRKRNRIVSPLALGLLLAAAIFSPARGADWKLKILPGVPSGVAFPGEKAEYRFEIANPSGKPETVVLDAIIQSPGNPPRRETREVTVEKGATAETSLILPTEEPGYWSIQASVTAAGGKVLAKNESALAVVPRPRNYGHPDRGSFFGSMFNRDPEAGQRIGIKHERQMAAWEWLSPAEGVYSWEHLDGRFELLGSKNTGVTLIIRPEMPPKWAPWKSLEELARPEFLPAYRKFVGDVVSRYRDRLEAVELVNEPDLDCAKGISGKTTPAKVYAVLLAEGYKAAKAAAPEIPVIGLDVSGVDFPALSFCSEVLAEAPGNFDIIGGHPYTSTRYIGGGARAESPDDIDTAKRIAAMGDLMKNRGMKPRIWPTEFGWAVYKDEGMGSPAAETLAAYVARGLALARSVPEVEKLFWFSWYFPGYEGGGFTYGLFRGKELEELYPTPGAVAYATTARFLDRVSFVGNFKLGDFVSGLRFSDTETGDGVFLLWLDRPKIAGGEAKLLFSQSDFPGLEVVDGYGRPLAGDLAIREMPVFIRAKKNDAGRLEGALRAARVEAKDRIFIDRAYLAESNRATVEIANNGGAPIPVKIFPADHPENALSRRLPAGLSAISVPLGSPLPASGKSSLPLTLMEEADGKKTAFAIDYNLNPVGRLSGAKIDGKLDETAGLPVVAADMREDVLPADPGIDWKGPSDLSMKVWPGWTRDGLYLAIAVADDIPENNPPGTSQFWEKDSLQIAIDTGNRAETGYDENCLELGVFQNGEGVEVRETYPKIRPLPDVRAAGSRTKGITSYEILVPWKTIGFGESPENQLFRMNVIANDNDGRRRKCWVGLSPGIGEGKRPSSFQQWALQKPSDETSQQTNAKHP